MLPNSGSREVDLGAVRSRFVRPSSPLSNLFCEIHYFFYTLLHRRPEDIDMCSIMLYWQDYRPSIRITAPIYLPLNF